MSANKNRVILTENDNYQMHMIIIIVMDIFTHLELNQN